VTLDADFGAEVVEFAVSAVRFAGDATTASVPDEQVGEIYPVFARDDFHQRLLDLFWRGLAREAHATREAHDVGVHDDAFGFAVAGAEDDVGGLASDAGELNQRFQRVGDASAVLLGDGAAAAADGAGFIAEETGRMDDEFEFAGRRGGKVSGGVVAREKGGCDLVDADVGALGAEDGGDEKLERVGVFEGATVVGVGASQGGDEVRETLGQFGLGSTHSREYSIRHCARVAV